MTYPAPPPGEAARTRVRPDSAQFWAGGAATAVVAALIALVGILVSRWVLHVYILAPARDGAWGNAHTGVYALVAALIAIVAAGLLYLLVLSTPRPVLFFQWIMGLATVLAVVYPLSTSAPLDQKAATAIVNLVLGLAITSLLTGVATRSVRRVRQYTETGQPAGRRRVRSVQTEQEYPPGDPRYAPEQRVYEETRPLTEPRDRDPRYYR